MKIIDIDNNGNPVEEPPADAVKTVIDLESRKWIVYQPGDKLPDENPVA